MAWDEYRRQTLTALATTAPVLIAPAMDNQMWENAATVANVELLRARGVIFVGPAEGRLASGRTGRGRDGERVTRDAATEAHQVP